MKSYDRGLWIYLSLCMFMLVLGMLSSNANLNDAFLVQEKPGGPYSLMGLDGKALIKDDISSSDGLIGNSDGVYRMKAPSGGYVLYKLGEKPQKLTDAVYDSVGVAAEGVIPVLQKDGTPLVLSTKDGKPLFEVKEYKGTPVGRIGNTFYGGINYYVVEKQMPEVPQDLYGFINAKGEFLTEPIYEDVSNITENDKVYGILPSADGDTQQVEVLNNEGKVLFSTTIRTAEGRVVLMGQDRCVIGDKIFDFKGEAVGRLPGESAVQCIGPRDYILARDGDVWYLLDKDGKEVTTIRNARKVFYDTTGKNYIVAGKFILKMVPSKKPPLGLKRRFDTLYTAYTIKGNKKVYQVTGGAFIFLKDDKFLLQDGSYYVMYDAKGKKIRGKRFSGIVYPQADGLPIK